MNNTEINRTDIEAQLEKYSDSQIEEIINELKVDKNHIRMNGTNYQKIIDLINFLETKKKGLQLLQETLKKKIILR